MKSARILLSLCIVATLHAHNPDTSYLRCVVTKHALELRFTFDIATLFRIARPDADGDGRETRAEMEKITPEVFDYLARCVPIEINGRPVTERVLNEVRWPPDAGDAILEKDYHQVLVHFSLRIESSPLIEDFYVNYDVFDELGERHRVVSDIEQSGAHHEIIFNQVEPDYVYDTGWTVGFPDLIARAWSNLWLVGGVIAVSLFSQARVVRGILFMILLMGAIFVVHRVSGSVSLPVCAEAAVAALLLMAAIIFLPVSAITRACRG